MGHPFPTRWYTGAVLRGMLVDRGCDDACFLEFADEVAGLCDGRDDHNVSDGEEHACLDELTSVLLHAVVEAVESTHVLRAYYLLFVHDNPFLSLPLQALSRTTVSLLRARLSEHMQNRRIERV